MSRARLRANPRILRHHFRAFDHEAEAKAENDTKHNRPTNEVGHVPSGSRQAENQPNKAGGEAGSADHRGSDDKRLRRLGSSDGSRSLHWLHRDWGPIDQAACHSVKLSQVRPRVPVLTDRLARQFQFG
jgi:hypothetical protein